MLRRARARKRMEAPDLTLRRIRWPGGPGSFSLGLQFLLPTLLVQILFIITAIHCDPQPAPRPRPIMTLPGDGSVYSLFPDEDLRTGRKFHRFEDDPRNRHQPRPHVYSSVDDGRALSAPGRNPALFRERQTGDRYRFRGEASYVRPNTSPLDPHNPNYIVRPIDNGHGNLHQRQRVAFDDERVRGPPNYLNSYRNRDLPFDPNPVYLPPRFAPSLLTPARRPMQLDVPTIHVYDPASQSFVPKGSDGKPLSALPGGPGPVIPPDPRIKVKPGRLLIPGLHNSISSEEAGPDTFLNHEEYLDYHTNIELDKLADLDRKMKAMQAKGRKGGYGNGNGNVNRDAQVVLFKGGSESSDEQEEYGSVEGEGDSGEEKQQPSQLHGEKSKVLALPTPASNIVATASSTPKSRFPYQSRSKESSSPSPTSALTPTRSPEVHDRFSPLVTLPTHLRDEASPSRLLQKLKAQQQRIENQELRPKADAGTGGGTRPKSFAPPTPTLPITKAMKSGLGTEAQHRQNQNQNNVNHGSKKLQQLRDDVPSSALHPPAPHITTINGHINPILQQKAKPSFSVPRDRNIEIIPSIITQSSSTFGGSGSGIGGSGHSGSGVSGSGGDGLIDGHFDIVPGVPGTIGFGRHAGGGHSFRNSDIADDFDENDNVARFRHTDSKTPLLYLETKQLNKMKADIKNAHAHTHAIVPLTADEDGPPPQPPLQHENENTNDISKNKTSIKGSGGHSHLVQKKMILVKRIKHLDQNHQNSSAKSSSSGSSTSSRSKSKKEYESTMTVHKIQETSDEKLDGGAFSAEKINDFNLQAKSTSTKGVVSKIHAHVSTCPKLDGPTEIICDVHIRKRHGNANPHLTVGWKRKFYNVTQPDIILAVNKTLAYEEDFHDKFNVTLAPGINPMLRSVLLIKHVNPPDTGNYQCEVTDGENHLKSETLLFLCH